MPETTSLGAKGAKISTRSRLNFSFVDVDLSIHNILVKGPLQTFSEVEVRCVSPEGQAGEGLAGEGLADCRSWWH